jgi:hypothetical protein
MKKDDVMVLGSATLRLTAEERASEQIGKMPVDIKDRPDIKTFDDLIDLAIANAKRGTAN